MIPFPGGTSVSHLRVYDWPVPGATAAGGGSAEGLAGSGTPHLHTASAEGYVVLAGSGTVQTLGADGFTETDLHPGVIAWFTPGVVHRPVNHGGLEILVVMSNAGLPEAGDAVLTFPPDVLADVGRYRAAATLPSVADVTDPDLADATLAAAARTRRDLALAGYEVLREAVGRDGPAALADLHAAAARLVADRVPAWQEIWTADVLPAATATAAALAELVEGRGPHLAEGRVAATAAHGGPRRYGMCGRLQTWPRP